MHDSSQDKSTSKKSANWIGILLFLLIFAGPQIIGAIGKVISQAGGSTVLIANSIIPLIIGGLVVLTVLVSIMRALGRASQKRMNGSIHESLEEYTSSHKQSFPTHRSSTLSPSQRSHSISHISSSSYDTSPRSVDLDWDNIEAFFDEDSRRMAEKLRSSTRTTTANLPKAPRFEPVVSGKVVAFSILGMLVVGGALAVAFVLTILIP
jgi:hypothetical protein